MPLISEPSTIRQLLQQAQTTINTSDAEILLAHVLNKSRSYLHTWPEATPDDHQLAMFRQTIDRRQAGEPVAYIVGQQEFWSLPFIVNRHTLIPRPETELLVETVMDITRQTGIARQSLTVLDLGTGSGCIALALAHEQPHWQITAVDKSLAALQTAQESATALTIDNVRFLQSDWFETVKAQRFDIIVSNPPYVAENDPHLRDIAYEPQTALVAGPDGLDALRSIITTSNTCLKPDGLLLLEIGHDQSAAVDDLMRAAGYVNIEFKRDLAGILRVCVGRCGRGK